MGLRYKIPFNLDSVERTEYHRSLVLSKPFLKKLYEDWYTVFQESKPKVPAGKMVEIGSGGGFLKEVIPGVLTSDILELKHTDLTFSGLAMPFRDGELSALFMIDTFHHIPDAEGFLSEVDRVLMPGGRMVMIEPANSFWGRLIYQNFHHEPFDPMGGWTFPTSGPMSGANGALPWIVFERDVNLFRSQFPLLQLSKIKYHTPFRYLMSGGLSLKQLVPSFSYSFFKIADNIISRISPALSMFVTIEVVKR